MKGFLWIALSMVCLISMSSCTPFDSRCGYANDYKTPYYKNSKCGPCLRYRCDFICDACSANEPQCTACWQCINNNACGKSCDSGLTP